MDKEAGNTVTHTYFITISEFHVVKFNFQRYKIMNTHMLNIHTYIQDVLLPDRQTLRGDSKHEDKHN